MSDAASELLGHRAIVDALWACAAEDGLHHAYLFEGPRGVGKATLAFRLALAVNCTGASSLADAPCGRCASCRSITVGNHPDVIRLEPRADRATAIIPVDDVREVVRQAGYRRYGARRRFILVDPAESLQPAAANALLKTLEEPPPGTGFILMASNASLLLPTILSRCQRIRFGAVAEPEILRWLERRGVDEAAACARLAQGCPGMALALAEGQLDKRRQLRGELLATLAGPLSGIFNWSQKLTRGGRQLYKARLDTLVDVITDLLRDATVHATGGGSPLLNDDLPGVVSAWADALWPQGMGRCQQAILDLYDDLEVNVSGRTAVDALLTRLRHELGPRGVRAGGA